MAKVKKSWKKPQLIILERGKPEEAVLASCKMATNGAAPIKNGTPCHDNSCKAQVNT